MKKSRIVFFVSVLLLAVSCSNKEPYSIVPSPTCNESRQGICKVPAELTVFSKDKSLDAVALTWNETITKTKSAGIDSTVAGHVRIVSDVILPSVHIVEKESDAVIVLAIDPSLSSDEYCLEIGRKGIAISGGAACSVFWGLQSLSQILLQEESDANGVRKLRGTAIKDSPKFKHRGGHLDCCRYFWSIDEVKTYLDILAMHKMNIFHWHLTEDQGWRIEIKKYPRLTEIGAVRKGTVVGRQKRNPEEDSYDGVQYGPFFSSQEEAREIVKYAADRFITVIPEIEMPGHNLAAIASYPWLSCDGKPKEVSMRWGVYADGVVCPSKETTYTFFEDVLDEVCEIFPSEYIHIGGDEAPRKHWENCPDCQKKMKMLGLTREAELQSCLNERIEAYLNSKGRKIIGWDEILEGGVTKTATVMSWRGPKGGIAAAKQGNRVIMTPNTNCYLDYYQTSNPQLNGEKTAFKRHYLPLEQCFDLDPFAELTEQESEYVVGIQGNVWCEYMKTFDHVQFMILPRLSALAEVAWSKEKKNYDNFLSRMEKAMIPTYKYHGFVFAPFAFDGTERYKKTWEEYVPPID